MPNALNDFGVLSELIQARAQVALCFMTKNGMRVDLLAAEELRSSLKVPVLLR